VSGVPQTGPPRPVIVHRAFGNFRTKRLKKATAKVSALLTYFFSTVFSLCEICPYSNIANPLITAANIAQVVNKE
jgi:hypothetical protein